MKIWTSATNPASPGSPRLAKASTAVMPVSDRARERRPPYSSIS